MTRQNQILRAWIDRPSSAQKWQSNISFGGKVHTRSSDTYIRKAAKEFAVLHLKDFLSPKLDHPPENQPELFELADATQESSTANPLPEN